MQRRRQESVDTAGGILKYRGVPVARLVLDAVTVILLARHTAELHFERHDRRHILQRGIEYVLCAWDLVVKSLLQNAQPHVLIGVARHESSAVIQRKRIEIERALGESERLVAFLVGVIDDVL